MTMPEQGSAGRPEAFLYSNVEPDEQQKKRFEDYLYKKYDEYYVDRILENNAMKILNSEKR